MTYTREIRKKLRQIEVKEAEIEALENDVRMAAFKHVVSLIEGDVIILEASRYISFHTWSEIIVSLKRGKEKKLSGQFLTVFLGDKKPVLIAGNEQIDIFNIKKIQICYK